jgi:FkbM family methyltransferase
MNYVFLGCGVGDLDPTANYRCGFTEFIKNNYAIKDNIYLVEANKKNIFLLKKCWENFENVHIFNLAIAKNEHYEGRNKLYYSEESAPHYQTCSTDIEHVKKFHPEGCHIKSFTVESISLNKFIDRNIKTKNIDYLSIDLEGIDYDVIMNLNLAKYDIKNISIEFAHMSRRQIRSMISKFNSFGYSYIGYGYDLYNLDYLFTKKKLILNQLLSYVLTFTRSKKVRHFINRIINK